MITGYPKYKISDVYWTGDIPEHWDTWKIRHAFNYISSGTTPPATESEWYDGDIPWITTSELRENIITEASRNVTKEALRTFSALKIHPKGSFLVAMYGATIGRVALLDIPATTNQACCALSDSPIYSNELLFFLFQAYRNEIIALSSGGGQPNISQAKVASLKIPIPPKSEQKNILDYLWQQTKKIDALIEKKNQFIERLKEKRLALISQVVTKGLPPEEAKKHGLPENPKMKPSGVDWLGDIPAHWTMKRVKHISTLYGRIGFRGYTVDDLVDEMEGAITLSPGNMFNGKFSFEKTTYISWEKYHESPEIKISPDDILMVKTGSSFGKIAQIREVHHPMTINPQLIVFKEIKVFHRFLFYYLISPVLQGQVSLSNTGGTIPTMTQANIGNYAVPFPTSVDEQMKVANYLDQETSRIDDLIEKVESAIQRLNEYRSAIITSAVTGKIDVRGASQ